jgi:hypothetical protein
MCEVETSDLLLISKEIEYRRLLLIIKIWLSRN